ncbi:MFS transporter [Roseovarius sp. E0-M6]|uniref:MFS transporter n=1 Tax=Roseovarius sp. E0-M6 TaxID=3127118 RepID=UPI0030104E19
MTDTPEAPHPAVRTVALYPWFKLCQNLLFWQAMWFLFFQSRLSAAEAILLYAIYDVATTALEVPSGYMSDRLGRRVTLLASGAFSFASMLLIAFGDSFAAFALAQALLGAGMAFASGTDTALLYESLHASGRADEVERQELRAWRFSFVALATSAVLGGSIALIAPVLPFYASALAFAAMFFIVLRFHDPDLDMTDFPEGAELARLDTLRATFAQPALRWLFVLSIVMYGFSHIPFVFGQPFIEEALAARDLDADAPFVSGIVTTLMMCLSLLMSLLAPSLRERLSLGSMLLLAFGMQIALTGALALSNAPIVIALLFLRMVPDALSKPFILARIQPALASASRATYISLQSFFARILFAVSLYLASGYGSGTGSLSYPQMQTILAAYALTGLGIWTGLALTRRKARLETPPPAKVA